MIKRIFNQEQRKKVRDRQRELRQWAKPHEKKKRGVRAAENYVFKKYGITLAVKQQILDGQEGRCGNGGCGKFISELKHAHLDHDHTTGDIRGILCNNCNVALGLLGFWATARNGLRV